MGPQKGGANWCFLGAGSQEVPKEPPGGPQGVPRRVWEPLLKLSGSLLKPFSKAFQEVFLPSKHEKHSAVLTSR